MLPDKMNYIFLDEIQHVSEYQKAVDSLFVKKNADVYITGSNAYFMSGELATLLSGRYVGLKNRRNIHAYLDGIYNTVILNDIVARKKIQDPLMLKSVIKFMFDNIGNLCTVKKIADSMTSAGRKISNHTVENYLEGITDSLLMYRVSRYDIKGKEYLQL